MRVLITGSSGFIGRNLLQRLKERSDVEVICFNREHQHGQLTRILEGIDFVFHLAGVNRPQDNTEYTIGNVDLTRKICDAVAVTVRSTGRAMPILYTSSSQAAMDNAYGRSKRDAELALLDIGKDPLIPVHIFRLMNVFGKWCRPNYNSVVATFCHNVAHNLPIQVNDSQATLSMVYIDDVIDCFVHLMDGGVLIFDAEGFAAVQPQYVTTVGEVARLIQAFRDSRQTLITERVGAGLVRALYATYISYLPLEAFAYDLPLHADQRGVFVEMLKTPDCGQFSFFTTRPGVTRGGHYHHSKTEKFLIIKGNGLFRFRDLITGKTHELKTSGDRPQIVETVPGWTHDITNIGHEEMVVMLWANENFDRFRPDTYECLL